MASPTTVAAPADSARSLRYKAQRVQWSESSIDRVRACGHHGSTDAGVGIRHSVDAAGKRSAGFSGLMTCGSVWACAVCNHKIATKRAEEVAQAIRTWEGSSEGRYVSMVTLTMRHVDGQSLGYLWDSLSYAWSKTTSGRGWKDEQLVNGAVDLGRGRRIPWVRFTEVTHGANGWHVHVHCLLFLEDLDFDGGPHAAIAARMFARWEKALVRKGLDAPIAGYGGLDVRRFEPGAEDVSNYLVKATYDHANRAGWEAAGGAMKKGKKGGRTPFQILAAVVDTGDADDLDLWHDFEQGSVKRRQMTWARGFRKWLELAVELSDDEIAAEELDGETLGFVDPEQWGRLRAHKAELLDAAETLPLAFLRSAPVTIWLTEYRARSRQTT